MSGTFYRTVNLNVKEAINMLNKFLQDILKRIYNEKAIPISEYFIQAMNISIGSSALYHSLSQINKV